MMIGLTGDNKYKFSYANSANPTFMQINFMYQTEGLCFYVPEDGIRAVGSYEADGVRVHDHMMHGKGSITGTITGYLGRTSFNL
jgi:hypothetical protein